MDDLAAVMKRFPDHEFLVRRLYASETEFEMLCEDYSLAVCALSRWKGNMIRAEEYSQLIGELEAEILEFINGRHPHQVAKSIAH
jgi:hypothetical protein